MSSNYTAEDSDRFMKKVRIGLFIWCLILMAGLTWFVVNYGEKFCTAVWGHPQGLVGKLLSK